MGERELLTIPNNVGVEMVGESKNCFKVSRNALKEIPQKNHWITILFEGTGYCYNGEIYHKNTEFVYIYLY